VDNSIISSMNPTFIDLYRCPYISGRFSSYSELRSMLKEGAKVADVEGALRSFGSGSGFYMGFHTDALIKHTMIKGFALHLRKPADRFIGPRILSRLESLGLFIPIVLDFVFRVVLTAIMYALNVITAGRVKLVNNFLRDNAHQIILTFFLSFGSLFGIFSTTLEAKITGSFLAGDLIANRLVN